MFALGYVSSMVVSAFSRVYLLLGWEIGGSFSQTLQIPPPSAKRQSFPIAI